MSRPNFSFSNNNLIISRSFYPKTILRQINTYKTRLLIGQKGQKQFKRAKTTYCSNCPSGGVPGAYCNCDSLGDAISWGCPSGYTADIMGNIGNQYVNCVETCGLNTCFGCNCNC